MRRSIATVCLSGTLADKLDAAAAAGFDGVEIFENDLIASAWSPAEIRARCADLGLAIDLYQPFRDFEGVPQDLLAANLRRAERKFDVMQELGARTLLVCSSVAAQAVDDDALAAEQLRVLAERAERRGLRIAYEALAWGRHVSTWGHSWEIVRRADHPALGLCLDSFHILSRESRPSGIDLVPAEKLFFLQLADAHRLDMGVLSWSRHHRLFPGQGSFDLPGLLGQILAAGYRGPLSLEVFNDVFRQADPRQTAVAAMRSLLALQESAGQLDVPSAPVPSGFGYVELSVTEASRATVAGTLAALGFVRSGEHRSRPVELWQQGEARVLLAGRSQGRGAERCDGDTISALAFESADPQRSLRRAAALLAAPAVSEGGCGETGEAAGKAAALTAPDRTAILIHRPFGEPGCWSRAFKQAEGAGPTAASDGRLTGIDQVTLTQPFDRFEEAALVYRALGLSLSEEAEYPAPFGLIRSRTATDPAQRVRVTLIGTLERRGEWSPGVPEPQHVTFTASDVFAAARAARDHGAPLLPIPHNYYADLDARLGLEPELLDRLQEFDVLYDRDEGGEVYHFFTGLLGSRIFFEVVQRVGAYRGAGVADTPVRMAAHRRLRQQHSLLRG